MFITVDAITNERLYEGLKENAILYAIRYHHAWEGVRSAIVMNDETGEVVYES